MLYRAEQKVKPSLGDKNAQNSNKTLIKIPYRYLVFPMIWNVKFVVDFFAVSLTYLDNLTLLCDNLKKIMFLQKFFSWHYFVMFFQLSTSFYYTAKQFHYGLKNKTLKFLKNHFLT
jgi:hypothetical protein